MDTTDDGYEDADKLAAQLDHADRIINELMRRVDALEAELACYWLAEAIDRGVA
jgi:hypothetical protein